MSLSKAEVSLLGWAVVTGRPVGGMVTRHRVAPCRLHQVLRTVSAYGLKSTSTCYDHLLRNPQLQEPLKSPSHSFVTPSTPLTPVPKVSLFLKPPWQYKL